MQLPSGRQARLARIVERHLPWFQAARRRGLGWDDIIEMLFIAGVKRANGQRLTRGHVSSLVWRKLKAAPAMPQGKAAHLADQRLRDGEERPVHALARVVRKSDVGDLAMPMRLLPTPQAERPPSPQRPRSFVEAKLFDKVVGSSSAVGGDSTKAPRTEATLDYMRRSAALRRRRDNDG